MNLCYKIFDKKIYAEQFMNGKIYFSRAGRFSNIKDDQRNYSEGMVYVFNYPIFIGNEKFDIPYKIGFQEIDRVPIFCCTSIDACNVILKDGRLTCDISPKNKELGKHVVVFDMDELVNSLLPKLKEKGYGVLGKKITYYDFEKIKDNSWFLTIKNQYDNLFVHDVKHKDQNEFRLVLTHKLLDKDLLNTVIDVGRWGTVNRYMEIKE